MTDELGLHPEHPIPKPAKPLIPTSVIPRRAFDDHRADVCFDLTVDGNRPYPVAKAAMHGAARRVRDPHLRAARLDVIRRPSRPSEHR
jgi:hypothetical protein